MHHDPIKASFDIVAAFITVGSFFNYLPTISAGLAIVWYLICLYEYFKTGKTKKD